MKWPDEHQCLPPATARVSALLWLCDECRTIWRSGRYTPWKITWRRVPED